MLVQAFEFEEISLQVSDIELETAEGKPCISTQTTATYSESCECCI
jgi:hypothetical protein